MCWYWYASSYLRVCVMRREGGKGMDGATQIHVGIIEQLIAFIHMRNS